MPMNEHIDKELERYEQRYPDDGTYDHAVIQSLIAYVRHYKQQAELYQEASEAHRKLAEERGKALEYIGHGPIGVFGEEFGWDFHYQKLRSYARKTLLKEQTPCHGKSSRMQIIGD